MAYRLQSPGDYVHLGVSAALIVAGLLIAFGIITLPGTSFWLPWILALTGVLFSSIPLASARLLGAIMAAIGIYLILKNAGAISLPILRYALGGVLVLIGVVSLVRDAKGGDEPDSELLDR